VTHQTPFPVLLKISDADELEDIPSIPKKSLTPLTAVKRSASHKVAKITFPGYSTTTPASMTKTKIMTKKTPTPQLLSIAPDRVKSSASLLQMEKVGQRTPICPFLCTQRRSRFRRT